MKIADAVRAGLPIPVPVIDAHTHIGNNFIGTWYNDPAEADLTVTVRRMDELGIDAIITMTNYIDLGMMQRANRLADTAARLYPGRIYGYITVCPGEGIPAVRQELEKYGDSEYFVGAKFLPGYHGSIDQPAYHYAADFLAERKAVLLIHIWEDDPPLERVYALAEKRPHLKVICAHQGGGYRESTYKLAKLIGNLPNLYADSCGSLCNHLGMEEIVACVGADRLIFGTDQLCIEPRYEIARLALAPLPEAIKRQVFAENYLSLSEDSTMGRIKLRGG